MAIRIARIAAFIVYFLIGVVKIALAASTVIILLNVLELQNAIDMIDFKLKAVKSACFGKF